MQSVRQKKTRAESLLRYRVCEPEIPSGIALKNKRRKRARDQNLNVRASNVINCPTDVSIGTQEPLRDSYQSHVQAARQAAQQAVQGITFTSRFGDMQIVARHAYALTFEREYVEQWEEQLSKGLWGGRSAETHEMDGDDAEKEQLRSRYASQPCIRADAVYLGR